ncbi:MAG: hypothetical protein HUU29_09265, partial [Planctomycetaceae bacterium]|nr:hypothetical protein [Planctomycetaceae bacterium]
VNLPLSAIEAGQKLATNRQTDERGMARLTFTEAPRYNGQAESFIGYELNPDLLLASLETGIAMKPWTAKFELPARGNTVVYLNLTEKYEGGAIKGPVRAALLEMIKLSELDVIEEPPSKDEKRFVLTIEGVLACNELRSNNPALQRQTHVQGALVFKSWPVPALASVSLAGTADIRDGDLEKAARDALADGWGASRETIIAKFREAFPPIFPASAERQ